MQRIAIVDPSDSTRETLRSMLLGVDFVWLEAECARYDFFFDVVQGSTPDLVILALDSDRPKALNLVSQLIAEYPNLPILAISSHHASLLEALQRGAKYFLTYPINLEELLSALRRIQGGSGPVNIQTDGSAGASKARSQSQVIAVMGTRGGVGTTSIAVNLGAALASDPANTVALMDLDLVLGDADVALDISPDMTIFDLAQNIDRLDMTFIKRSLARQQGDGASALSVLCHPLQMQDAMTIQEEHLQRIVNLLKISYNYLILDLSKSLLPTDKMALALADTILLVTHLELSSLRNVVRTFMLFGNEDGLSEKVRVVVNRVGAEFLDGEISLKKAEEVIGKPIYWQLPNDTRAMMTARSAGKTLFQAAPKSRIAESIKQMTQALSGKAVPEEKPTKKRGWFG